VTQILVVLDREWYKTPYGQATIPGKWINEVFANVLREFNGAVQLLNG
jgi:hypothetical protein